MRNDVNTAKLHEKIGITKSINNFLVNVPVLCGGISLDASSDSDVSVLAVHVSKDISINGDVAVLGGYSIDHSLDLDWNILSGDFIHVSDDGELHPWWLFVFLDGLSVDVYAIVSDGHFSVDILVGLSVDLDASATSDDCF